MLELIHSPVIASGVSNSTSLDPVLDPVLSGVHDFIQKGWPTTCQDELLQSYFKRQSELHTDQGCVLWGSRVVILTQLRDKVLQELHESHPGICRMKALTRSYVWWLNMDQQIERVSEEFVIFSKQNGIQHIFTAPYHPASNNQAERNVQTFKMILKKIGNEGGDSIETKVSCFLFTYRITTQTTTNCSPVELLFKRRLHRTLTLLKPDMYNKVKAKQTVAERNSHRMRSL